MVFVRAMHESGFLQDMEVSIYDSWCVFELGWGGKGLQGEAPSCGPAHGRGGV